MEMSRGLAADRHVPVMLTEILDALAPSLERSGALYVDATLGMGGHTEAVLERFGEARAIGIDRDTEALRLAGERLARFGDRFEGVHAVNTEVADVLPRPCLLYTSPSPRDLSTSRMPSSA